MPLPLSMPNPFSGLQMQTTPPHPTSLCPLFYDNLRRRLIIKSQLSTLQHKTADVSSRTHTHTVSIRWFYTTYFRLQTAGLKKYWLLGIFVQSTFCFCHVMSQTISFPHQLANLPSTYKIQKFEESWKTESAWSITRQERQSDWALQISKVKPSREDMIRLLVGSTSSCSSEDDELFASSWNTSSLLPVDAAVISFSEADSTVPAIILRTYTIQ